MRIRATLRDTVAARGVAGLKSYITGNFPLVKEFFVNLGNLKTARVLSYYPGAAGIIERELALSLCEPVSEPDATIWFWRESGCEDFMSRVLGLEIKDNYSTDDRMELFYKSGEGADVPMASIDMGGRQGVHLSFGNEYFYGLDAFDPENWFKEGHIFVQAFFRILNGPDSSLVHGACVGVNGKGVLLCARGGGGKSTLSVMSMLRGFEYVSDDYLVLEKNADRLSASPIYSFITLSPRMYDSMYNEFDRARFIGVSPWKGKYVFDIAAYRDNFRWNYPVKALLFPEITPGLDQPCVSLCETSEKGKTIVQIAHSTINQMSIMGFKGEQPDDRFVLKTIKELEGFDCYKISLSGNLEANVECLREFIDNIN